MMEVDCQIWCNLHIFLAIKFICIQILWIQIEIWGLTVKVGEHSRVTMTVSLDEERIFLLGLLSVIMKFQTVSFWCSVFKYKIWKLNFNRPTQPQMSPRTHISNGTKKIKFGFPGIFFAKEKKWKQMHATTSKLCNSWLYFECYWPNEFNLICEPLYQENR